jgi:hypothetical protein
MINYDDLLEKKREDYDRPNPSYCEFCGKLLNGHLDCPCVEMCKTD